MSNKKFTQLPTTPPPDPFAPTKHVVLSSTQNVSSTHQNAAADPFVPTKRIVLASPTDAVLNALNAVAQAQHEFYNHVKWTSSAPNPDSPGLRSILRDITVCKKRELKGTTADGKKISTTFLTKPIFCDGELVHVPILSSVRRRLEKRARSPFEQLDVPEVCVDFPWEDFESEELLPSPKRARFVGDAKLTQVFQM